MANAKAFGVGVGGNDAVLVCPVSNHHPSAQPSPSISTVPSPCPSTDNNNTALASTTVNTATLSVPSLSMHQTGVEGSQKGEENGEEGVENNPTGVSEKEDVSCQGGEKDEGGAISCPTGTTMNCSAESGCSEESSDGDDDNCD